jgi:hypothetical protein
MNRIAEGSLIIQSTSEAVPSTPCWCGGVVVGRRSSTLEPCVSALRSVANARENYSLNGFRRVPFLFWLLSVEITCLPARRSRACWQRWPQSQATRCTRSFATRCRRERTSLWPTVVWMRSVLLAPQATPEGTACGCRRWCGMPTPPSGSAPLATQATQRPARSSAKRWTRSHPPGERTCWKIGLHGCGVMVSTEPEPFWPTCSDGRSSGTARGLRNVRDPTHRTL